MTVVDNVASLAAEPSGAERAHDDQQQLGRAFSLSRAVHGLVDEENRRGGPERGQVHRVALELIRRDKPLRSCGVSSEHVRNLAAAPHELPPILIHESTMRIVDGLHRYLAAKMRGDHDIAVIMFRGSADSAFVAAVHLNVRHGLPLSIAERERAARRIVETHPDWSDRRIAVVCAISPKTVAAIRCSTEERPRLNGRVGRDGRVRPFDPVAVRERVAEVLKRKPSATLREVAADVGTSQATVLDVRQRLERGENPIPPGLRRQRAAATPGPDASTELPAQDAPTWTTDSACSATDDRAQFASWFERHVIHENEWEPFIDVVPISRAYPIIDEALERARSWTAFANALRTRVERSAWR